MPKEGKLTLRESIRQAAVELDMPSYIMLDIPRIEMVGNGSILIERHHGILQYSDTCVEVAAKDMKIKVSGMQLELKVMNKTELSLGGIISSVEIIK